MSLRGEYEKENRKKEKKCQRKEREEKYNGKVEVKRLSNISKSGKIKA
jgi:hypothetical protein